MNRYLCLDIGGTSIKSAIFDKEGDKKTKTQITPTFRFDEDNVIDNVQDIIGKYFKDFNLSGVCISSAGVIDSETGQVMYSGYTIPRYTGTRLKEILETKFNVPCEVENDVNAAALGEYWLGAAKNCLDFVCMTVGTGIGGAIVLDGKLKHGIGNTAAEIGYMNIMGNHFQDLASTTALLEEVNKLDASRLYSNGKEIFLAAKEGNPYCIEAIDKQLTYLAIGISNIIYLINPEKIVLGGGVMAQKDYIHEKLVSKINEQMLHPRFFTTEICYAENENDAGMLGALYHYQQKRRIR